ncbi:MAG: hypothetical protein B9S38_08500 [Verrucomicrobiia bacterium Tous-C4TDCM]|nr:MAG: hypothetical protein B9S38_08500 [Verrucomicrobiae bacterium Tous-C4TDCM]
MNPAASSVGKALPGFALVITLSLMVLLTVLVTGLLGLSSIALRSGGRDELAAQARANARMALMIAIGELQKQGGPDTRVTARADILDEKNPPVLGIWKSWEGSNHDSQGRPISPGNYKSAKAGRFIGWLASGDPKSIPDTTERKGSVALVGPRTVGEGSGRTELQIHLEPEEIDGPAGKGGFAWWIGGENQKARLPVPHAPAGNGAADWAVVAKSHSVADPAPFRMDQLLADSAPAAKAISLGQGEFVSTKDDLKISQEFFHDLSTSSVGLLTNTATGGWRKDLSLVTENWNSLPSSNLPFFRQTPAKDITFSKPTSGDPAAAKSMIYPWSSYRGSSTSPPIYRHGPVSSWENLVDYATTYKRVTSGASGKSRFAQGHVSVGIGDTANTFNFLHRVRILPIVSRIQWVFSHSAGPPSATNPPSPAGNLEARLLLTPIITMWNPYNVEITGPALSFSILKPLPPALQYTVNGVTNPTHNCLTGGSNNNKPPLAGTDSLNYTIPTEFPLKPGETRVFSPAANNVVAASSAALPLEQGYRGSGGQYFVVQDATGQPAIAPASATIKADAKFDTEYNDRSVGVGIYLDMSIAGPRHLVYRMVYTPAIANEVYKPLTQLAESTLGAVQTTPEPFMSTVFGARMASKTHIPAKGFVQSSPLVNYTAMGGKDVVEDTIQRHYGGTSHPVNSPFDYSFIKHAPGADDKLPNASDTSGRGYIVTGFTKSNGLSRCIIAEIPTRPLISLGELQNWDLRYENPIPPYAFNLIGNSDASPLLPANAVVNSADASLGVNLQHDDSYCANHLLFDDWFFSSIAPDPSSFGPTGGRNQQKTFTDFVSGIVPLDNRAYRPIERDSAIAATDSKNADQLFKDYVAKAEGYRSIASRLEVDGMFNVNSTSVTAWRALLGHARNQRVPYVQESGGGWSVDLSGEVDHPFSRFSIAGDVEAGKAGSSGGFPEASEFAGYRLLDDEVIEKFAEKIVDQVRARGPFLSLAEFVNRQLSSGDLALAGAIQSALDELAKSPSTNPYKEIQSYLDSSLTPRAVAVPVRAAEAEYQFPAAAAGYLAYGVPGWTRQADVLRPLAPILSARDDTFTIRAHGDARDKDGNIVSRAVCEAVVRRTRDYLDPKDAADLANAPAAPLNKTFGRRFEMVSFRWLSPSEI